MKTNLTGIHHLAEPDYRALSAINKSGLDHIAKSPAHYQQYLKTPVEPTPAMIVGQATHMGVFEPELLYRHFFARPEGIDGRTKEGKEKLSELGKQHVGKTMLKAEEMETIEGIMRSVRSHRVASQLISGGIAEASAIAQDPEFGILCKARPDYMRADDTLIDLKTTETASFRAFQRSVVNFRYHVQAAWYLDVVNAAIGKPQYKKFILIAVEKEPPYGLILYELDAEAIRIGRMEARSNLKTYAECVKADVWPGYPESLLTMTVPEWA